MTEKQKLQEELKRIKERLQEIDDSSRSVLGRNLLRYRNERGLTQVELASMVDCTRVTITNIETGATETRLGRLMKICLVLGVTPNDLLLEQVQGEK